MSHTAANADTTTAAMCLLFVDKFAGAALLNVLGPRLAEVMEQTGVTLWLADGEPLGMAQSNH